MKSPSPEAEHLYEETFPLCERRAAAHHRAIAAEEKDFYPMELHDTTGAFVGILYYWYWSQPKLLFVEHLAIVPAFRGKGYGHAALRHLHRMNACIILEIEPVTDAVTARRLAFYESAGFARLPFEHVQHPYHVGGAPVPLELLSFQTGGTPASAAQVAQLEYLLRTCVMLPYSPPSTEYP